jgi:nitrous oxide reductase
MNHSEDDSTDRNENLTRRQFVGSAAMAGAAAAIAAHATPAHAADLPVRGEFVVRNAHVLTMDPAFGGPPAR